MCFLGFLHVCQPHSLRPLVPTQSWIQRRGGRGREWGGVRHRHRVQQRIDGFSRNVRMQSGSMFANHNDTFCKILAKMDVRVKQFFLFLLSYSGKSIPCHLLCQDIQQSPKQIQLQFIRCSMFFQLINVSTSMVGSWCICGSSREEKQRMVSHWHPSWQNNSTFNAKRE